MNKDENYTASVITWRDARERRLRDPHGWLATAGLFWLAPGENRMGSDPLNQILLNQNSGPDFAAIFERQIGETGDEISLVVEPGVNIQIASQPIKKIKLDFKDASSELITLNDLHIYVIRRGDRFGVRIFDPANPELSGFHGLDWFQIDHTYCFHARFIPFEEPRFVQILDILGDWNEMHFPGLVEFELKGQKFCLEPVEREDGGLWLMFRDLTNGSLTYPAGRYLNTDPVINGTVMIDFNKCYSPPCAFTPFATCPLPPPANRLPVEILAGEMNPSK